MVVTADREAVTSELKFSNLFNQTPFYLFVDPISGWKLGWNPPPEYLNTNHFSESSHVTDTRLCTCQEKGVGRRSPPAGPAPSPALWPHLYENPSAVRLLFPAGSRRNGISSSSSSEGVRDILAPNNVWALNRRMTQKHIFNKKKSKWRLGAVLLVFKERWDHQKMCSASRGFCMMALLLWLFIISALNCSSRGSYDADIIHHHYIIQSLDDVMPREIHDNTVW